MSVKVVKSVMIGCDPELFLLQGNTLHAMPAFGLFGGSKEKPLPMKTLPAGFAYLEDNAALEFNIPPQRSAAHFVEAVNRAMRWLRNTVIDPNGYVVSPYNVMVLEGKYLKDKRAGEVGCEPDFDAYKGSGDKRDRFTADTLGASRYAGGHIHLSYNREVVPQFVAARFLDLFLALPYIRYDKQGARRKIYGCAGLFRPKDYGLEYRTMSNWWVNTNQRTMVQVAQSALDFAEKSYDPGFLNQLSDAYSLMPWDDVQKAVATEDQKLAALLVDMANRRWKLGINEKVGGL